MKKIKIIYWTSTILFAGFMIFSSIPDILLTEETKQFITHLGYPEYIIPFLGVAKILGCIAIVVPSFKKIKEWAYAGLIFELVGAFYSLIKVDGFQLPMTFMILIIGMAVTSYIYNGKLYNKETK